MQAAVVERGDTTLAGQDTTSIADPGTTFIATTTAGGCDTASTSCIPEEDAAGTHSVEIGDHGTSVTSVAAGETLTTTAGSPPSSMAAP